MIILILFLVIFLYQPLQISNQDEEFSQLSKSQFIKEQKNDPELNSLIQRAKTDAEIDQVRTCYYLRNGILMRKWRPPEISADDE